MKARIVIAVIVMVCIVLAGIALNAWVSRPLLIEVYPHAEADNVPVTSPIRLIFSRPMKLETVSTRLQIEPAVTGTFSWDKNILTFIPEQPWPGGQVINVQLTTGARAKSLIVFPMGGQSWSFTTSREALAYLWPSNGAADIYTIDPVTGDRQQYTHRMGVLDYSVSSDGMKIYFSAGNSQGGSDLYQIDRLKANSTLNNSDKSEKLLECGMAQCRNPAASFDGDYLAYEYLVPTPGGDLSPAQIWLLNLAERKTSPMGQTKHETVQPSWSPTGWLVYYDRTSHDYEVVNPLTQVEVRLSNQTGQPGTWSPNGKFFLAPEISYIPATGGTETGASHLIRYSVPSIITHDLTGTNDVEDVGAEYSPDGGLIAFARKFLNADQWTLGRQIWVMQADGSNPRQITDEGDYNHYDLAWNLEGDKLAYVRFNQAKLSDLPELWMINANGSNPIQLVVGGYSPIWIP